MGGRLNALRWLRWRVLAIGRRSNAQLAIRLRGGTIGRKSVSIRGRPMVRGGRRMRIGSGFIVHNAPVRSRLGTGEDGHLVMGDNVGLNHGVSIHAESRVTIGSNVLIGDYVSIFDTHFHEVDEGEGVMIAPVTIGDHVFIGQRVIVMPGVTIGDHVVVAANSVVTKSIPAGKLAGGNPAQVIRDIKYSEGYLRAGLTWD